MALRTPIGAGGAGDDRVAFEELWADREILTNYCRRLVGDMPFVDDMVQEAYAEAFVKLDRLERRASFLPWLATVAKRRGLNELRRYRYSEPADTLADRPEPAGADPAEIAVTRDQVARLRDALLLLTPRERALLMEQAGTDKTIAELARDERSTPASVRSVLGRARAKLRTAVEDGGAWALAPLAAVGSWARRRLQPVSHRAPDLVPIAHAGGYERLGEVVAAVVVAATVTGSPGVAPTLLSAERPRSASSVREPDLPDSPTVPSATNATLAHRLAPVAAGPAATPVRFAPYAERPTTEDAGPTSPTGFPAPAPMGPAPSPPPPDTTPPPVQHAPAQEPDDAVYLDLAVPGGLAGAKQPYVFALGHTFSGCQGWCSVLYRTDDAGVSWQKLGGAGLETAKALLVPPDYPRDKRIYAMSESGLLISTDHGATFGPVSGAPHQGTAAMSPLFSAGDERIAIGSSPPVIYDASSGLSAPFSDAPMAGPSNHFAFAPDYGVSGLLFAGTMVSGPGSVKHSILYRCTESECDDGTVLPGLRRAPEITPSAQFGVDGVVLAWADNDLYRSTDRGLSFEPVGDGSGLHFHQVVSASDGTFYAAAEVTGTMRWGVARSEDGGLSWHLLGAGTPLDEGVDTLGITRDDRLIASPRYAAKAGLWCSDDRGESWERRCR